MAHLGSLCFLRVLLCRCSVSVISAYSQRNKHSYLHSSSTANRICKKGYRRCINGRCIGHQFWCDGTDDCGDHSDELPCNSKFPCTLDGSAPLVLLSKSLPLNSSVPLLLVTLCKAGEFQCKDGSCISHFSRCDQVVNCEDASDEMNCRKQPDTSVLRAAGLTKTQSNAHMQVFKGASLMRDCLLPSESTDCSRFFRLGAKGASFHSCERTTLCYLSSWVCDGNNDCGDFSDERNCPGRLRRFYKPFDDIAGRFTARLPFFYVPLQTRENSNVRSTSSPVPVAAVFQ